MPNLHRGAAWHGGCNLVSTVLLGKYCLLGDPFRMLGRGHHEQGAFSIPGSSWSPHPASGLSLRIARESSDEGIGECPSCGRCCPCPPGTPLSKAPCAAWTPHLGVGFLPPAPPRRTLPALLTGPKLPNSSDACHICGRTTAGCARAALAAAFVTSLSVI